MLKRVVSLIVAASSGIKPIKGITCYGNKLLELNRGLLTVVFVNIG